MGRVRISVHCTNRYSIYFRLAYIRFLWFDNIEDGNVTLTTVYAQGDSAAASFYLKVKPYEQ